MTSLLCNSDPDGGRQSLHIPERCLRIRDSSLRAAHQQPPLQPDQQQGKFSYQLLILFWNTVLIKSNLITLLTILHVDPNQHNSDPDPFLKLYSGF